MRDLKQELVDEFNNQLQNGDIDIQDGSIKFSPKIVELLGLLGQEKYMEIIIEQLRIQRNK